MAHHRCTRCKEESHPRHKHMGGVFCDTCIRWIRGYRHTLSGNYLKRVFGSIWDGITDLIAWVKSPFTHTHIYKLANKEKASAVKVAYNTAMARGRHISMDPSAGSPQKR